MKKLFVLFLIISLPFWIYSQTKPIVKKAAKADTSQPLTEIKTDTVKTKWKNGEVENRFLNFIFPFRKDSIQNKKIKPEPKDKK